MRGGKRPGAGRKPGSPNRSAEEIAAGLVRAGMKRAERAARRLAQDSDQEAARAAREAKRQARAAADEAKPATRAEARAEQLRATILPPLETPEIPPGILPLDFLRVLMEDSRLPITFRRDCAVAALPFAHAKPILGLKDARRLAAWDDDEDDDEIAAVMRGERPN